LWQGSERLGSNNGTSSDDAKDQRILITPELWSQPDPGDYLPAVRVDSQKDGGGGDGGGSTRRRRSNADETEVPQLSADGQKVRKINICDRLHAASRRPACRGSTGSDGLQQTYLRGTVSPAVRKEDPMTTAAGGPVKTEVGVAAGSRPAEGLMNLSLPWMPTTSSTPVSGSLPSPFPPRGFFAGLPWPHATPPAGFPPHHVRAPTFPAATASSVPLGFGGGAPAWPPPPPPAGLVQPTTMFVPYPIPIPLPLPLPIPIPVPLRRLDADASDTTVEVCSGGNERHEDNSSSSQELAKEKSNRLPGPGDGRSVSSVSTVATSSSSSSSEACAVLDLSVGGRSTADPGPSKLVWTDAVAVSTTVDSSPYLARRSLILDAPTVDRKCFGAGETQPGGGGGAVRGTSASVPLTGKRFNHHRRRSTQMPLVKSK